MCHNFQDVDQTYFQDNVVVFGLLISHHVNCDNLGVVVIVSISSVCKNICIV